MAFFFFLSKPREALDTVSCEQSRGRRTGSHCRLDIIYYLLVLVEELGIIEPVLLARQGLRGTRRVLGVDAQLALESLELC